MGGWVCFGGWGGWGGGGGGGGGIRSKINNLPPCNFCEQLGLLTNVVQSRRGSSSMKRHSGERTQKAYPRPHTKQLYWFGSISHTGREGGPLRNLKTRKREGPRRKKKRDMKMDSKIVSTKGALRSPSRGEGSLWNQRRVQTQDIEGAQGSETPARGKPVEDGANRTSNVQKRLLFTH